MYYNYNKKNIQFFFYYIINIVRKADMKEVSTIIKDKLKNI